MWVTDCLLRVFYNPFLAVIDRDITPQGCVIIFPGQQFWVGYVAVLLNETCNLLLSLQLSLCIDRLTSSGINPSGRKGRAISQLSIHVWHPYVSNANYFNRELFNFYIVDCHT